MTTEEQVKLDKRIEFVEDLENSIKKWMPDYCQINHDIEDKIITVWVDYSIWLKESDSLLKHAQKKYPSTYKSVSFINIPFEYPEITVSHKEIIKELKRQLVKLKKQRNYIDTRINEVEYELKNV